MTAKIQQHRGLEKDLPILAEGQIGFTTDTKRIFIGSNAGNVEITNEADLTIIKQRLDEGVKELSQKVNASDKATSAQAQAGTDDNAFMTPLKVLDSISENSLKFINATDGDFNKLTKQGNYTLPNTLGLSNAPLTVGSYYLQVINRVAGDYAVQFARRIGTNEYFTRSQVSPNSTTWTSWQPVVLSASTTAQAQAGTDDTTYMTPLKVSQNSKFNNSLYKNYLRGSSVLVRASRQPYIENDDGSLTLDMTSSQSGVAIYSRFDVSQSTINQNYAYDELINEVGAGNPITFSFDLELVSGESNVIPTLYFHAGMSYANCELEGSLEVGKKVRVYQTRNLVAREGMKQVHITIGNGIYKVSNFQIQKGSYNTSWNPSPYDTIYLNKSTTAQAQSGTDDTTYMTPLKVLQSLNQNSLSRMGNLLPTDDLNNIINPGIYGGTNGAGLPTNHPSGTSSFGNLIVFRSIGTSQNAINQIYMPDEDGGLYFRSRFTNSTVGWRTWSKVVNSNELGQLSNLQTQNKSNLVSAINEVFQEVDNGKNLVASAITDKGVATPGTATFQELADAIESLTTNTKSASGYVLSSTQTLPFNYYTESSTVNRNYITVSGLDFKPSRILICRLDTDLPFEEVTEFGKVGNTQDVCRLSDYSRTSASVTTYNIRGNSGNAYVNNTGFRLPVYRAEVQYYWEAYE